MHGLASGSRFGRTFNHARHHSLMACALEDWSEEKKLRVLLVDLSIYWWRNCCVQWVNVPWVSRTCFKYSGNIIDAIRPDYIWHHDLAFGKCFTPSSTKLVGRNPYSLDFIECGELESNAPVCRTFRHSDWSSYGNSCLGFTELNDYVGYFSTDNLMGTYFGSGFVFLRQKRVTALERALCWYSALWSLLMIQKIWFVWSALSLTVR